MTGRRFSYLGNDGVRVAGSITRDDGKALQLMVDTKNDKPLRKPYPLTEPHGADKPREWRVDGGEARADAYTRLLQRKRQFATPAGFDVSEADLNPALFPFQRKAVAWALIRGKAALFLDCVAGETIVNSPDGDARIDELAAAGKPIRVWSLAPNGERVAAWATCPFLKGTDDLWEVTLQDGRSVRATKGHRFLTEAGWKPVSEIRVGERLAVSSLWSHPTSAGEAGDCVAPRSCSREPVLITAHGACEPHPGYAASHPPSSSELAPSVLSGDGQHCTRTTPGSPGGCRPSRRLGDAPLPSDRDSALASLPSLADALEHNSPSMRGDDRVSRSSHTHQGQSSGPRARMGFSLQGRNAADELECLPLAFGCKPFVLNSHTFQLGASAPTPDSSVLELHPSGDENPAYDQSSACDTILSQVSSIHYIRTDVFYDLHVPGYENYLSNGIWSHNTGLGKTLCELVWAEQVTRHTGKPVLIFTPLAVAEQCVREGAKFGIEVTRCKSQADVRPGINVTNYQRMHLFDPSAFSGLVLDESGILKGEGPTRKGIVEFAANIHYRLAATATPAPNELTELVNHSDYLGIMELKEVLATFFRQGEEKGATASIHKWRLKGHAKETFWRWVASWAVAARKPSDWGFDDTGYDLPPVEIHEHIVELQSDDFFGVIEAHGMKDQRRVRRETLNDRVAIAAELANTYADEPLIVWAELNPESEALRKAIPGAVEITGALSDDAKEARLLEFLSGQKRVLVSKPTISGHGLNLQFCARQIWCGIGNSHEQRYQGIRRSHRFGQTRPVQVHLVRADADGPIARNLLRKELQSGELMDELIAAVQRDGMIMQRTERAEMDYQPQAAMSLPSWLKGHG